MKLSEAISANLARWMAASHDLDTIKRVSTRSGVGFGTVQRMLNGSGNPTISNLADVAHAFGKQVEDLLMRTDGPKEPAHLAAQTAPEYAVDQSMADLLEIADSLGESGRWQLVGMARILAKEQKR